MENAVIEDFKQRSQGGVVKKANQHNKSKEEKVE